MLSFFKTFHVANLEYPFLIKMFPQECIKTSHLFKYFSFSESNIVTIYKIGNIYLPWTALVSFLSTIFEKVHSFLCYIVISYI